MHRSLRHRSTEETISNAERQTAQIEQGQEIDRFELPIQSRRATDFCTDCEIGSQQFRDLRMFRSQLVQGTLKSWPGFCSEFHRRQMATAKVGVSRRTNGRILRCDGTAANEISSCVLLSIVSYSLPE